MTAALILLAGGSGNRFYADKKTKNNNQPKKQYLILNDKPVFIHTLQKFIDISGIVEFVLVCSSEDREFVQSEVNKFIPEQKIVKFVSGGSERVYSVVNGFESVSTDIDLVIIHDAVRPFINKQTILESLNCAYDSGAAIVAVPAKDTIKLVSNEFLVKQTLNRANLYHAQTPQVFNRELFAEAIRNWRKLKEPPVTDDAMLFEMIDKQISIVVGDYKNIKLTTQEDLTVAKGIISTQNNP